MPGEVLVRIQQELPKQKHASGVRGVGRKFCTLSVVITNIYLYFVKTKLSANSIYKLPLDAFSGVWLPNKYTTMKGKQAKEVRVTVRLDPALKKAFLRKLGKVICILGVISSFVLPTKMT